MRFWDRTQGAAFISLHVVNRVWRSGASYSSGSPWSACVYSPWMSGREEMNPCWIRWIRVPWPLAGKSSQGEGCSISVCVRGEASRSADSLHLHHKFQTACGACLSRRSGASFSPARRDRQRHRAFSPACGEGGITGGGSSGPPASSRVLNRVWRSGASSSQDVAGFQLPGHPEGGRGITSPNRARWLAGRCSSGPHRSVIVARSLRKKDQKRSYIDILGENKTRFCNRTC